MAFSIYALTSCTDTTETVIEGSKKESASSVSKELKELVWLEGTWMDTTIYSSRSVPQSIIEKWSVYPDSLSGVGMMLKAKDTTITERLCIRVVNDNLTYIVRAKGMAMISFTRVPDSLGRLVFENPINEFPSKVSYNKLTNETMNVIFEGFSQGFERKLPMSFFKVSK